MHYFNQGKKSQEKAVFASKNYIFSLRINIHNNIVFHMQVLPKQILFTLAFVLPAKAMELYKTASHSDEYKPEIFKFQAPWSRDL